MSRPDTQHLSLDADQAGGNANGHTIDERIDMNAHMDALRFYYDLVRNFDASHV